MIAETLLRNTASNAVFRGVSQVATILTFIVLYRIESKEVFGTILVFQAILINLSILDLGLGNTLEKYVAKYLGEDNRDRYSRAVNINVVVHVGIGIVGLVLFGLLGSLGWLEWLGLEVIGAHIWLLLGSVALLVWSSQALHAPLRGLGLFPELNRTQIVVSVAGNGLLILAAVISDSLALMLIARYLPMVWAAARQYRIMMEHAPITFAIPRLTDPDSGGFWAFSGWNFLTRLASQVTNEFDKVLVSIFLGPGLVPMYYGIMRVLRLPVDVNQVLKSAVIPVASTVQESGDNYSYRRLVVDGTTQANAIFAFFAMLVILYAYEFLFVLGGPELVRYDTILQWACLISMPVAARGFLAQALIGTGEVIARQALWSVLAGAAFVAMLWFGLTRMNVEGGILARPLNQLPMMVIWLILVLSHTRVPVGAFIRSIAKGQWPFWAGIAGYLLVDQFPSPGYVSSHVVRLVILVTSCGLAWHLVLDEKLKDFVKSNLRLNSP